MRVDPQSSAKLWKEWIHKVVLEMTVPSVKLFGCSAGLTTLERCPNSDFGTFEEPPVCSVSFPISDNWPNSDVDHFQRTSRMSDKLLNASKWPNSDFGALEKPSRGSVVLYVWEGSANGNSWQFQKPPGRSAGYFLTCPTFRSGL